MINFIVVDEPLIIDRSKFYAYLYFDFKIDNLEEIISNIRKEHKKARHVCYAYRTTNLNNQLEKYDDDGEPKGTAGIPILTNIQRQNLNDVLVVVVRYFGNKKLGSSKLLRTYSKSSSQIINKFTKK